MRKSTPGTIICALARPPQDMSHLTYLWLFQQSEVSATYAFFIPRFPAGWLNYTISIAFPDETAVHRLCQTPVVRFVPPYDIRMED